jgi:ribose 1,5-bisphosphokinase
LAAPAKDRGTLVLVVGPSGSGKDTLISYCRSRLSGDDQVVFARRMITRAGADESEDHHCVSEAEFQRQAAAGAFAIHWQAHGLYYGVPVSVDTTLAKGRTVVVNGSRSIVDAVRRRYRPLLVVSVTARRDVVAARLRERGRESRDDIDRRLARGDSIEVDGLDVVRLDNSGPIEAAGEALLRLLVDRQG